MTPTIRSTALSAALLALSCGALAVPITFEDAWKNGVDKDAAPIELKTEGGFTFSGAWGYKAGMLKAKDQSNPVADVLPQFWDLAAGNPPTCSFADELCNFSGFIMNRPRDLDNGRVITVEVDPSLGRYIESVSFRLFTNATGATLTARNATGDTEVLQGFTAGGLRWTDWPSQGPVKFGIKDATVLEFDFRNATVGLDNLDITLTNATNPPAVPEPGGFALVGLALLAAGTAVRRRPV